MSWKPVTETAANLPDDALPFVMTNRDRDLAAIVRCDIEAMQRQFRMPEGVEVREISMQEFLDARDEFRRHL